LKFIKTTRPGDAYNRGIASREITCIEHIRVQISRQIVWRVTAHVEIVKDEEKIHKIETKILYIPIYRDYVR